MDSRVHLDMVRQMIGMQRMFIQMGMSPMYSDAACGRLLAYAALSGCEEVVTNPSLNGAILCAQDTFNLKGGEIPHVDKLPHFRKAMLEMKRQGTEVDWWVEFANRYAIDKKRWPSLTNAFRENFSMFNGIMFTQVPPPRMRGDDEDTPATILLPRLRGDNDGEPTTLIPRLRE